MEATTDHLQVSRAEILGRSRARRVVQARSLVVYLARQHTAMSYPELATALDRPHHSTLISAVQRVTHAIERGDQVKVADRDQPVALGQLIDEITTTIRTKRVAAATV